MTRREHRNSARNLKFSLHAPFQNTAAHAAAPAEFRSPVDRFTRSVNSMKRFFTQAPTRDANSSESPPKRARRNRRTESRTADVYEPAATPAAYDDFYVPPERNRRHGVVFENVRIRPDLARSHTLPTRGSRDSNVVHLADIDFTQPLPEWVDSRFIQTSQEQHFDSPTVPFVPFANVPPATYQPYLSSVPPYIVDFVSLLEFRAMQDTTSSSLSALPPNPGYLQDMLLTHILTALTSLMIRAAKGLKSAWGAGEVALPNHFIDAILYVVSACKFLGKTLTSHSPQPGEIGSVTASFVRLISLIIQTAHVIDAMDLLALLKDTERFSTTRKVTKTLETLITASSHFVIDAETSLLTLSNKLDASVPNILFPSRFRVHEVLAEHHFDFAIHRVINESKVPKLSLEKLGKLIPTLKGIGRRLDRIASEEPNNYNVEHRSALQTIDVRYSMLRNFHEGTINQSPKQAFIAFHAASTLAKRLDEKFIHAESLYRMSVLLSTRNGKPYMGLTPQTLLITARTLNTSMMFQVKTQRLLLSVRRMSISSLLEMATMVLQENEINQFVQGVEIFIKVSLQRYTPVRYLVEGNGKEVDVAGVLKGGDIARSMLRVVRVFHPDKNMGEDEEGKWVCAEITKVFPSFL